MSGPRRFVVLVLLAAGLLGGLLIARSGEPFTSRAPLTGPIEGPFASTRPSPSTGGRLASTPQTGATTQDAASTARQALRTGRYEEVVDSVLEPARRGEAPLDDHRALVEALRVLGRYEEAERAARRWAETHPGSVELHNLLGEVLVDVGRLEEAEEAFSAALTGAATDELDADVNLAVLQLGGGRVADAMQRFDRFIDYYNSGRASSAEELVAVGIACRHLGRDDPALFQDAVLAFERAAAADPGDPEPRIRMAELFLDKYDSAEADSLLADVLQNNPRHPRALLAMARRHAFDGSPEALTLARQALEVNPSFVDAKLFVAEQLLALEDFAEAAETARQALDINPASRQALAVMAAAHFVTGDPVAFAAARDRALALNPVDADFYNDVAEICVNNRLYRAAVDFAETGVELDPQSWRGWGILGLNRLRVGDIEQGRADLERAFAGDPYNVWIKNTLDLLDTFADYEVSDSERFRLMIEGDEAELLSLYVAELAEEAYESLAGRYGYRPPTPVRVEVYPSHADFSVRTVGLAGLGALGVSFGPVIALDSPSARDLGDFNWGSTLWHEIAHTFTLGATDFEVPRWLSEGLSVHEERRARPGWGDDVDPGFLIAWLQDRVLPVSDLTYGFIRPQYPAQIGHSYFQASLVCELIEERWGFDAILAILEGYRAGRSTTEIWPEVTGMPMADFDRLFVEYVEERFARPLGALQAAARRSAGEDNPGHGAPPSAAELERLAQADPADFVAQLRWGAWLVEQGRGEEAVVFLERARDLFPEYAGPDSPYRYLARVAVERGDAEAAVAALRRQVAINEKDHAAHLELAGLLEELGNLHEAAEVLERVIYIDPLQIPLHERLAELYGELGDTRRLVRERRAVVALDPVDRAEALYLLALAHWQDDDVAAARRQVLAALEVAPSYAAAQELLLKIVEREASARGPGSARRGNGP